MKLNNYQLLEVEVIRGKRGLKPNSVAIKMKCV